MYRASPTCSHSGAWGTAFMMNRWAIWLLARPSSRVERMLTPLGPTDISSRRSSTMRPSRPILPPLGMVSRVHPADGSSIGEKKRVPPGSFFSQTASTVPVCTLGNRAW
jgi:hypothetical protein